MKLDHFAIRDFENISFTSWSAKDRSPVESQVKSLGELGRWVSEKANLSSVRDVI
jgi:hypothetical protein